MKIVMLLTLVIIFGCQKQEQPEPFPRTPNLSLPLPPEKHQYSDLFNRNIHKGDVEPDPTHMIDPTTWVDGNSCKIPPIPKGAEEFQHMPSGLIAIPIGINRELGERIIIYNTIVTDRRLRRCK